MAACRQTRVVDQQTRFTLDGLRSFRATLPTAAAQFGGATSGRPTAATAAREATCIGAACRAQVRTTQFRAGRLMNLANEAGRKIIRRIRRCCWLRIVCLVRRDLRPTNRLSAAARARSKTSKIQTRKRIVHAIDLAAAAARLQRSRGAGRRTSTVSAARTKTREQEEEEARPLD